MRIHVDCASAEGKYRDVTAWQNTTLRYSPPKDFPAYLADTLGRAAIMRVFITLDEYWEISDGSYYEDYEIGRARVPVEARHYPYDWAKTLPAPSGTRFEDYLTSHAAAADALLLNVRRLEREVSDGVISYEKYAEVFENAVRYCKRLAPNIRYVECCNEVDLVTFGNLSADEYARIYLVAHRVIRKLNKQENYAIPLQIGGYSAAFPISDWGLFRDVMHILRESEIGDDPMDFYSYHHYEVANMQRMLNKGMFEVAEKSDVEKLQLIVDQHHSLLASLGLPARPVFLDELGRAKCTDVAADCLYNAAGLITYLIAVAKGALGEGIYPFPWCTFHNPSYQISYTQFLLNADGSYAATPNGIALMLLHRMHGDILETRIENEEGRDAQYRVLATRSEEKLCLLCVNPTADITACQITLSGLDGSSYRMTEYRCDEKMNNCVTGNADGKLNVTAEQTRPCRNGTLDITLLLERDNFVLLELSVG